MPPGLAERLRAETWPLHREVERAGIMPALLRGQVSRQGYGALLRQLHALYAALEDALRHHAGSAPLAPIAMPALFRTEALAADLMALAGPHWPDWPLCPAAEDYVARLREIDAREPARLAGHAYVRYLGDLSGGQTVGRVVREALGLPAEALRFYDFGGAGDELAMRFRGGLANCGGDPDAIIDEAKLAFRLHARLFEELAADAAALQPLPASRRSSA